MIEYIIECIFRSGFKHKTTTQATYHFSFGEKEVETACYQHTSQPSKKIRALNITLLLKSYHLTWEYGNIISTNLVL